MKPNICEVLTHSGFVYTDLGDYNTAVEKLSEALQISKEADDKNGVAGASNNLGIVLQNAGRLEKAREYFNNSLKTFEELGDQANIISVLSNLGTVYFDLKDYSKAADYHGRGLELSRKIVDKDSEAHCLLNLANDLLRLGKLEESMSNYKTGLEFARSLDNPELTWKTIAGMAENHEIRGEFEKSVELNDTVLKILEGLRYTIQSREQKTSFMAAERYAFEDVINMLADLHLKYPDRGYDLRSFGYAEDSKARALLDLLTESLANIKEGVNNELVKKQDEKLVSLTRDKNQLKQESVKEQFNKQMTDSLKEIISKSEKELDQIKKEIIRTNPRYAGLKYPEPISLKDVQEMCPDNNTVFLEYLVGDSSSCLWVITRLNHNLYKIPDRKKLQEQVETIRFALLDPKPEVSDFFTQAGHSLYEELIKPAEPYLSRKSRLIIIPDGILNYLPFEVLLTDNKDISKKVLYSILPFLVKKYPVSYGQSASVIKNLLSEPGKSIKANSGIKRLIAFGDPEYDSLNLSLSASAKSYSRLKYSREEIDRIASFFNEGNSEVYLGEKATEENIKKTGNLAKFNYLHFATHGYIDEDKPDFSSLVLTKGPNSLEDGLLQAAEIFNLNLKADLVVLSACQTGLGKMVRGEGMVGLTRAFMYAGTPSVLVSLWNVSDKSTATLMGEFYKNLIKNKLSKTDALHKAKLTLISNEKLAHPFYWAPFILIGDWR
jgi:CHAT domain-containing protein/Tfp pilus assembly protein PilF